MNAGIPLIKSVRFTQTMSSLLQLPHCGETSSHFFLRARHVRQPEFDLSLPIDVSCCPPGFRYSEICKQFHVLAKQGGACGGSEAGSVGGKIVTGFGAWRWLVRKDGLLSLEVLTCRRQ
jgi:hypothetical protein